MVFKVSKFVDTTCIVLHALSLLVVVNIVTVPNINFQRPKLGDVDETQHSTLR